jgi:mRNA interferase MazF
MQMRKGEIWRVRLPFGAGHKQAGERPALIVQNNAMTVGLPTVLAVPFTSKLAARRFPGTLVVAPDANNGLTLPSVALVFQVGAQDKQDFVNCLGVIDDATLAQILALIEQLAL